MRERNDNSGVLIKKTTPEFFSEAAKYHKKSSKEEKPPEKINENFLKIEKISAILGPKFYYSDTEFKNIPIIIINEKFFIKNEWNPEINDWEIYSIEKALLFQDKVKKGIIKEIDPEILDEITNIHELLSKDCLNGWNPR